MKPSRPYLLAGLWFCTILVLTTMPTSGVGKVKIPHLDKAVHAVLFGVFSLLISWFLNKSKDLKQTQFIAITTSIGYGVIIECIQYLLPYRSFSLLDILADAVGAIGGYWVFRLMYLINKK